MSLSLEAQNISKGYSLNGSGNLRVLDNINFVISSSSAGSITSILAPIRAGKSSLLKILSSIETADEGVIFLDKKRHNSVRGSIIYLPEKPASFPWMSVRGNIEMASKLPQNKKKINVGDIINMIGLTGYEDHFPNNQSYGFRFRISLGRALAVDADIILIDDSFALMDSITKGEMYSLVKKIKNSSGKTIILATTNITEAVILSDRILFMKKNPGRIFNDLSLKNDEDKDDNYINTIRTEVENIYKNENTSEPLQLII